MKTKIILLLVFVLIGIHGWGQNKTSKEWIKNPTTSSYSLKYEQKVREDLYVQNQMKYVGNVNIREIDKDIKSANEESRLNAIKILGLIAEDDQVSMIENLLANDPSLNVQIECAKSLKYLKSTGSIPLLIKTLETPDQRLKLEIALTLAALGEKTESLKALIEIGKLRDRNIVINTHIGYLDLATNDAIEILKSDLSDVNSYISVDAAIILSELGYSEVAFQQLKAKLSDKDKYIRMAAMRGLAYIGNDSSIELIKGMLTDEDSLVKERSELILNISRKSNSVTTSYSPSNAASYAEQWYGSFNPAYANYDSSGGDCANFGSQCLKAGGMNLSSGPGLDKYGCIIACDNLHTNFTTYQGCNSSSTYSGHKTGGYPTWFSQGDIVLFGANASSPSDPWQHTAINVVTGTPALDAHSYSRHKQTVSYFYPSTGTGFKTADFYHFSSSTQTGYASVSQGITISPTTVISGSDFTTSFTLKETKGASITFESIVCAITNTNNTMVRDMEIKGPITISANSTYNYSSTFSWRSTDGTGNFRAWARGKVAGGDWFDFTTSGGTNPKDFQVNLFSPQAFTLTLTPECYNGNTSQLRLNWTESTNATSYEIYRDGSLYYPTDGSQFFSTQFENRGSKVLAGTSYSYYVRAKNAAGTINSNVKSATAPDCTPTITITSPNGNETWQAGSTQTITWTSSTGVTGNVQIQPYIGSSPLTNIAPSAPNTGSYSWTIPSNYTPSSTYRIGISAMSGTVSDFSNNYFTISTPECSITSIQPSAVTHGPASFSTTSGSDDIIITGQANCNFNVTENCSWLTVTPMSGTTNSVKQAFLNYSIEANTTTSARQCTFYVNDSPITITQNACSFEFYPTTKSVSGSGSTYNLYIYTDSPCSWNIQNSSSWVHLSQISGTGYPTITVTVDPNMTCDTRACTLTISPGNQTHVITQPTGLIAPTSPISVTASKMSVVNGQSTTLQVVGGALNSAPEWIWYTGSCGSNQIGSGATITVSPTLTTTYYVQASACGTTTACRSITINNTTAINDISAADKVMINPNPTTGKFEITGIEVLGNKCKVEVYDHSGMSIYVSVFENFGNKISLDLNSYSVGIYIVKLSNQDLSFQKKVIKI